MYKELAPSSMHDRITKNIFTALAVIGLFTGLYILSRYNYAFFHSLADMVTVFIAGSVFIVVWNGRRLLDNHYYLYVGIAFLSFALLDFIHLLGNRDMGVFPQYGNLGPTLYIASRYVLSLSLIIAPLFIRRKVNITLTLVIYALVTILALLSIFYWQNFPVTYIEGEGLTRFKIISDYIICLILAGAIALLVINRRAFDPRVLKTIIYSLILSIATGLAFTLYTDPFGITNAVGHFLQIGAFYLVYRAFIETVMTKPQDILFRNLKQSKDEVLKLNTELQKVNLDLKQDIARRQEMEEELQRYTRELEATNQEMEAFSYSVSHDLRAPLRTMDGFSEAVLADYGNKLDETGKDYLTRVRRASQTMSELIDDILKLSRINRAGMRLESVNLSSLAQSIMEELKANQPERQVELNISPEIIAKGDKNLLQIGLRNILENSWKYTGKSPTARIEFGVLNESGEKVYYIRDNGIGFDMQYASKLFQPFQRLHTIKEYPGTGIGLATVQRVIRRHNGRIWAEAESGKGATFYFTLG
jgi:signal transduction histidine kinase